MTKDDRYGATQDNYDDAVGQYANREPEADTGADAVTDTEPETPPTRGDRSEDADEDETDGLPFIFARRTVKADREAVPVYLRSGTASLLQDLERDLETEFDADKVMSLDVREAVLRAGLANVEDVKSVMREWGYGRR